MTQREKQSNGADLLRDSGVNAIAFGKVIEILGDTVMTVERLFDDGTAEGYRAERARSDFPADKFADAQLLKTGSQVEKIVWKLMPGMRFFVIDYHDDIVAGGHSGRNIVHRVQLLDDNRNGLQFQEAD